MLSEEEKTKQKVDDQNVAIGDMQPPLVSVIIVNFNVKEFLEQALVSVQKSLQSLSGEIIVVDNASTDDSVVFVKERFPDVRVIENSENLGFATASNQGLRLARGTYLALLNPDTIVKEDTFSAMLKFYDEHPDTGMLGCKILNPDGSLQLACRRSFPTPWVAFTKLSGLSYLFPRSPWFGKYNLTYLDENKDSEVEAVSGSFLMIKREVLERVGYLDEAFFLYGEDLDWCYRVHQEGWKVRYFPGTHIIHFKGESSKHAQFDHLKVFYQAMSLFVQKHFKSKYLFMPYRLLLVAIWIRAGLSFSHKVLQHLAVPLIDFMFLSLAMVSAIYIRFGTLDPFGSFAPILLAFATVTMILLNHFGCYRRYAFSASKAGFAVFGGFLVIATGLFFLKQYAYSRFVVLIAGCFSLIALSGWRLLYKVLGKTSVSSGSKSGWGRGGFARKTVIVGDLQSGRTLINKFRSQIDSDYEISGLVNINGAVSVESCEGVQIYGALSDLPKFVRENNIQEVIFATDQLSHDKILELIARLGGQGVNFKLVASNLDVIIGKASIDRIDDVPLLDLDYKLNRLPYRFLKRSFDFVLAAFLAILTFPILIVRSIFGTRVEQVKIIGTDNHFITLMEFKSSRSPYLRKLPYLWSVLRGELSFVGTQLVAADLASEESAQQTLRLKPGITGLAQINSQKSVDPAARRKYDLFYMQNYSLLLDVEILIKTLFQK